MAAAARVLVVDDEPVLLRAIVKQLIRHGYDALPASGPRQALEIVRQHPPADVVISDVMMPEMLGTDLIREIARLSPKTASILMTGGVVNSAELPLEVPLLRKPVSRQELIAAIHAVIARSAKLMAEVRESIDRSAELQQKSKRLKSERRDIVEESVRIISESRKLIS